MHTLASASKNATRFAVAATFCFAVLLWGCGQKQTAPLTEGAENLPSGTKPSEPPLDQQIEQKLDPLTKDDVELYLKVMRTAAERVKNPTPADQAALDGAKKIIAARTTGHVPTPDDVKTLAMANLVAISMDQIVAEEMKLDGRSYRGIAEAIEAAVPNPLLPGGSGGSTAPAATPTDHALTPLEKRLSDVNAANEKFLAPYGPDIQKLIAIVRNPANLPK
jgi:hypothetical protein